MGHRIGIAPSELWTLTPYVLGVLARANAEDRRAAHEALAWSAWHSAALVRCKKMPSLNVLLGKRETAESVDIRLMATLKSAFPIQKKGA